jgi:hypothetical protein
VSITASPPPGVWQGYALPSNGNVAAPVRRTSHRKLIGLLVLTLALVVGVVVGVSALLTPHQTTYICPPDCGHPPVATPVSVKPRFTGPNSAYSVEYDPSGDRITSVHDSDSVTETWTGGDGGTIRLFGTDPQGGTAQQVATALISKAFPNASRSYVIPNAVVGFQPGYGEVDDINLQSSNGTAQHERLIVMVAVKNGLALVGEAIGPYHPSTPDHGDGHASGAALDVALYLLDPLLNSFTWSGDAPR